jgi:hypothetical protein
MAKRIFAFVLILLTIASSSGILLACGDKFLVFNRGTRFQRAVVPREPAAILIYANSAAELLAGAPVDATLRKAGYRPTTVATTNEFENALSAGGWDVVLVSVANVQSVTNRLSDHVAVVPILFNATDRELRQTRKQYKHVLNAPAKSQSLLETIDEALAHRPKPLRKTI